MFDGHIMSDFMQYPQIPNFYIANLETDSFLGIFTCPKGLQAMLYQKDA